MYRSWIKVTISGLEYVLKGEITGGTAGTKTFGVGGQANIPGVGEVLVSVGVVSGDGTRPGEGSFPFGIGFPGGAVVGVNIFGVQWTSGYHDCDAHTMKPSSGKVNFSSWGTAPGSVINGSTSFTAYTMVSLCDKVNTNVALEWHIVNE